MLMKFTDRGETRKRRIATEEFVNRDGNWYRDFSVRAESWTVIEHWAHEHGYHLVSIKGRKRVYRKGYNEKLYQTLLEIRHEEGRVVITGWINVGITLRLLTLFILPSYLPIDATGYRGIRVRRATCRDLNSLMSRFRQPEIAESDSFHPLDMDLTTLGLIGSVFSAIFIVLGILLSQMEIRPALAGGLLHEILNRLIMLFGVASLVLFGHHWGVVKLAKRPWASYTSLGVLGLSFWILSIFSLTQTKWQMLEHKFVHSCVIKVDAERCAELISGIDPKQRALLIAKLNSLQKELAVKP